MAMMIDSMVNIRDFELMVSDTDMSKAGKGPMNIEIHLALADELITRLREAEKDAERYRWLRDIARHEYDVDDFFDGSSDSVDGMIDKAMKEKGDE